MDLDLDLNLDFDFDDTAARLLSDYVRPVTAALGLRGDSSFVSADRSAHAYIALDGRLPDFPGHDVALLWDENRGWAAAIEDAVSGDLVVVARLETTDPRPAPSAVVSWVRSLFRRENAASPAVSALTEPLDVRLPAPRTS